MIRIGKRPWRAGLSAAIAVLAIVCLAAFSTSAVAAQKANKEKTEAQGIVDMAKATFNSFMADENFGWLHENLKNAKGLLIYPQVLKAGFIFGGSGGTGVLVVRDEKTNDWSQPAFYTLGAVTFGLQIGGEAAQVVVMAMSQKAVDSLLTSSLKLGGDISVATGPVGVGAKGNVTADFISFAKSKGLYAGVNLEGSSVNVRDKLNEAYYGKAVTPVGILVKKEVSSKRSAELLAALKKATR